MNDPTVLYRGQGYVLLADIAPNGLPTGYLDLGNCPRIEIRSESTQFAHTESRSGKGATDAIIEKANSKVSLQLDSTAGLNLYRYLYGTLVQEEGRNVENEPVILYGGGESTLEHIALESWTGLFDHTGQAWIPRIPGERSIWGASSDGEWFNSSGHGLVANTLVQLTGGQFPFVSGANYYVVNPEPDRLQLSLEPDGTPVTGAIPFSCLLQRVSDYQVDLRTGTIKLTLTSRIQSGERCWASYSFASNERIFGFTRPNRDVALLFKGLNTATEDAVRVTVHRVRLDPAQSWPLIGQGFTTFDVEGSVLWNGRNALLDIEQPSNIVVYVPPPYIPNFVNVGADFLEDIGAIPLGFVNAADMTDFTNVSLVNVFMANPNLPVLGLGIDDYRFHRIEMVNVDMTALEDGV